MKKLFNYAIVLLAGLTVALSCSKIEKEIDNPVVEPETEVVSIPVTVMATLPDVDTKVAFEATFDAASKPTAMKRTWEASDKLRVIDSTNPSMYEDLDLESGDGTPTAVFHGNLKFTASSYNVEVVEAQAHTTSYGVQTQAANGDTNHLQFVASATGVTDLTAAINLTETSGVLGIIAKLPASATDIESVDIVKISDNSTVLKINLTDSAVGSDQVLKLFANMQAGMTINSGAYFIRFNAPSSAEHKIYTRYYELANPVAFATHTGGVGEYRTLKLNCVNTDKYAGGSDKGTSTAPYLIADGYQLAAINSYASTSATTYIKMIDNVDMTGITHTPINEGVSGYSISVNFDGNNKTISKLAKSLFYVFKGSIKDLTLDSSSTTMRGILAEYCQGSGHTITNVTISNGTVSAGSNVGALIGRINSGSGTTVTITDCTITDTNVTGTSNTVGGMIGSIEAKVVIDNCDRSGGTVSNTGNYTGGLIGRAQKEISVSNCDVNTTLSCANYSGGIIGSAENNSSFTKNNSAGTVPSGSTIGGFAGMLQPASGTTATLSDNSTTCTVSGKTNMGGFVGVINGTVDFSNCSSSGTSITSTGNVIGGFAGSVSGGTVTIDKCWSSINVNAGGSYSGGFLGQIINGTTNITRCYATGSVTSPQTYASSFIGNIHHATNAINVTIQNCYATGDIINSNQMRGGLIGQLYTVSSATVSNCYITGAIVGSFRLGGLIGNLRSTVATVENCVAWNSEVTASSAVQINWSSGAIIGTVHPNAHVSNCYRKPGMSLTVYCPPPSDDWDQPDVDGTTHPLWQNSQTAPFTWEESSFTDITAGTENVDAGRWAYHGKHVAPGTTLSQLASTTLGWDSSIWDFSGELPTLK